MVSTNKFSLFKICTIIFIIAVIGISLIIFLTSWNAQDQIFFVAKFFFPVNSEKYSKVIFHVLEEELDKLSQKLTEDKNEKGIVSVLHGYLSTGSNSVFHQFVFESKEGKAAKVIIIEYTIEGASVYKNVMFDGEHFFTVIEISSDRSSGETEENMKLCYDYLLIITHPETGSKFVILTNDAGLTFEKLRDAQIGSNMKSIDCYQLFSYSD